MTATATIDANLDAMRQDRATLAGQLDRLNDQLVADLTDAALKGKAKDVSYVRGQIAETAATLTAIDTALDNEAATRRTAERADAIRVAAEIAERRRLRGARLPETAERTRVALAAALEGARGLRALAQDDESDEYDERVARERAGDPDRPEPGLPNISPDLSILGSMLSELERSIHSL